MNSTKTYHQGLFYYTFYLFYYRLYIYIYTIYILFQTNANTSTAVLSREQKAYVRGLVVKPPGQHDNSKAKCWLHFSQLDDSDDQVINADTVYWCVCLEARQALDDKGHISTVTNFPESTSSGNMNQHLSFKHDTIANSDEKYRKVLGYMKKNDGSGSSGTSQTKKYVKSWTNSGYNTMVL